MLHLQELAAKSLSIIQASQVFAGIDRPTLRMLHLQEPAIKSRAMYLASLIFVDMGAYNQCCTLRSLPQRALPFSGQSNICGYGSIQSVLHLKELAIKSLAIFQASLIFAGIDRPTLRMLHLQEPAIKSLAMYQASKYLWMWDLTFRMLHLKVLAVKSLSIIQASQIFADMRGYTQNVSL